MQKWSRMDVRFRNKPDHVRDCSGFTLSTDFVEKLIGFAALERATALICLGCPMLAYLVSQWRAPSA